MIIFTNISKRLFFIFSIISMLSFQALAHDGEKEIKRVNDLSSTLPFYYISQGDWLNAAVFSVMWIIIIKGLIDMLFLVLSRVIIIKAK